MKMRAPLAGVLAAVLLAVGFWFLLYSPKADEQSALETETVSLQDQQAQLRSQIAQLREVQAAEAQHQADLTRLEEYIPGDPSQPRALREFQVAADAAGVEITTVTFGDPATIEGAPETGEPDTALAEIPVTMTVDGGYFQVVDLMRRLEVDVPRALLIESVNVAESPDNFPALATTWAGKLFAVVPVTEPPPPVTPEAEASTGAEAPADATTAPADAPTEAGAAAAPTEQNTESGNE